MEITIKGDPKEIAALVVALQERQKDHRDEKLERLLKVKFM